MPKHHAALAFAAVLAVSPSLHAQSAQAACGRTTVQIDVDTCADSPPIVTQTIALPAHGGPVAVPHRQHDRGLIALGAVFASVAWAPSLLIGAGCAGNAWCSDQAFLLIPVVGPALAMANDRLGPDSRMVLGLDLFWQVLGSGLMAFGFRRVQTVWIEHREWTTARAAWSVMPYARRDTAGVMAGAVF